MESRDGMDVLLSGMNFNVDGRTDGLSQADVGQGVRRGTTDADGLGRGIAVRRRKCESKRVAGGSSFFFLLGGIDCGTQQRRKTVYTHMIRCMYAE